MFRRDRRFLFVGYTSGHTKINILNESVTETGGVFEDLDAIQELKNAASNSEAISLMKNPSSPRQQAMNIPTYRLRLASLSRFSSYSRTTTGVAQSLASIANWETS